MALTLPRVNRAAPVDSAPEAQIKVEAPDLMRAVAPQQKAAENFVEEGVKYFDREVEYAIDTKSREESYKYENYLNEELSTAKQNQGDPIVAYDTLRKNQTKMRESLEANEQMGENTRAAVKARLQEVDRRFADKQVTAFGSQNEAYQKKVTNDSAALAKQDLVYDSEFISVDDKSSDMRIQNTLNRIYDIRVKSGLKTGTVTQDADGNYVLNPSVKLEIAKDYSEGLSTMIENLNASGKVDEAKMMTEKFGKYLGPKEAVRVNNFTMKSERKQEALQAFEDAKNMSPEKAFEFIGKMSDPEAQIMARGFLNTFNEQKKKITKDASATSYNDVQNIILDRQKAGTPFLTVDQMENDPVISRVIEHVTDAKQRKALYSMVEKPKDSNEAQKGELYQAVQDGSLAQMSYSDFLEASSGLNKTDHASFEKQWNNLRTETKGEENQKVRYMTKELTKSLLTVGYVKHNRFGKYDDPEQKKINAANDEMISMLDTMPKNMGIKEQQAWVNDFALSKKRGTTFTSPTGGKSAAPVFSGGAAPRTAPVNPPKDFSNGVAPALGTPDSREYLRYWATQYQQANNGKRPTPGTRELTDFIATKAKK